MKFLLTLVFTSVLTLGFSQLQETTIRNEQVKPIEVIKLPGLEAQSISEIVSRKYNRSATTRYQNYPLEQKLYLFMQNGKFGIADETGKILIPAEYDKLGDYVAMIGEKYGVVDLDNQIIIPFEYDMIDKFTEFGYAKAEKDGKFGYLFKDGTIQIPFDFLDIQNLNNTFCKVKTESEKWGMYNVKGQKIIDTIYDQIDMQKHRYFVINKDDLYGVKTAMGSTVLPLEYEHLFIFGNSYMVLVKNGKMGLFKEGQGIVIPLEYDRIMITNPKAPSRSPIKYEKGGKSGSFTFDQSSRTFKEE